MRRYRGALAVAVTVATALLPATATTTATAGAVIIGPTVRTLIPLSHTPDMADCDLMQQYGFPTDETEPTIAVNPANTRQMAVSWLQGAKGTFDATVVATTADGGRTWRRHAPPLTDCGVRYANGPDGSLSYGPDGVLYLSALRESVEGPPVDVVVTRSVDNGETWSEPVVVAQEGEVPRITADPFTPKLVHLVWYDNATVVGINTTSVRYSSSHDGGAHWDPPTVVYQPTSTAAGLAMLRVLPNRNLLIAFLELSLDRTVDWESATYSSDHGQHWSTPTRIAVTSARFAGDPEGPNENDGLDDPPFGMGTDIGSYPTPSLDVGPDGTAYVAWQDIKNAGDAYSSSILVSSSKDSGATWSAVPSVVKAEPTQAYMPTLAVTRDGTVGVTYYDLRNDRLRKDYPDDDELTAEVWFAASADRGTTWSEAHLAGPFDTRDIATGEYFGLAGAPGGFVAAIEVDKSDPEPPRDIWYARIDSGRL